MGRVRLQRFAEILLIASVIASLESCGWPRRIQARDARRPHAELLQWTADLRGLPGIGSSEFEFVDRRQLEHVVEDRNRRNDVALGGLARARCAFHE